MVATVPDRQTGRYVSRCPQIDRIPDLRHRFGVVTAAGPAIIQALLQIATIVKTTQNALIVVVALGLALLLFGNLTVG